jgi:hypothetical protein
MSESVMSQSTNHILMIEPEEFFANPETMTTNVYQVDEDSDSAEVVYERALSEFRGFRNNLVEHGVIVTTLRGKAGCPDMVFPNWASTHEDGRMVLYPMLNDNRRAERDPAMIAALAKSYPDIIDWTHYEDEGKFLEARGSIVSDRVNKRAYATLSDRTNRELAEKWAQEMGYSIEIFNTTSHTGKPVYHTDLVIWIGSTLAGVCSECIVDADRARIVEALKETHAVVEFSNEQLRNFCGNALEVVGRNGAKMLALSEAAYQALEPAQKAVMEEHFTALIHTPLPTLEQYGGGSARCCLMELY